MELLQTRRVRWMANNEVSEQDAYQATPEEWTAIVADNPLLAAWGVFRFPEIGRIVAVSPPAGCAVIHDYCPVNVE